LLAGGGGLAGGSLFTAPVEEAGAGCVWCAGACGGAALSVTDMLDMADVKSFINSSFSVFRANEKSETFDWKVTSSW